MDTLYYYPEIDDQEYEPQLIYPINHAPGFAIMYKHVSYIDFSYGW